MAILDSFRLRSKSMAGRLLLAIIPAVVLILAVSGYVTYRISANFIAIALQRNAKVQNLGQAQAIESYLESCKRNLLFLTQGHADSSQLRQFLEHETMVGNRRHPFLAFVSIKDNEHILLVQNEERLIELPSERIRECSPDPLALYDKIQDLKRGNVWLSGIRKSVIPFPTPQNTNNRLTSHVLLMVTPMHENGEMRGYLTLAITIKEIRNILSVYNSDKSPLWAYARSPEVRYSFFFNLDGWVLFQSENPDTPGTPLSTYLLRSECVGTMGMPGLESAFRPDQECLSFWDIAKEVRNDKQGLFTYTEHSPGEFFPKEHSTAYAPIRFRPSLAGPAQVYAGVAFEDRSRLTMLAGYKHVDVLFMITLVACMLTTMLIYLLCRIITRPLYELARSVKDIQSSGSLEPIEVSGSGSETLVLQESVNNMLGTMRHQLEEIHIRDLRIMSDNMREPVDLSGDMEETPLPPALGGSKPIPEILGKGRRMDTLREEILKASKVDVDVLILGETGTGKQLTAEAIHNHSPRRKKPLISINCGELDENLLMDTLFGHVKGAFTEAKAERKGAFLEADGGTLFLDEIQVASPRVQQSLLRAIALRKIKPLGSDKDLDVDVRVIAATNVDLRYLIKAKLFREDLYFRLKVITILTPPLREHKENILLLAMYYLREGERLTGKQGLALSKGALERMQLYPWPGNIRELRNCVTRAAVMCEDEVIQADELLLDQSFESGASAEQPISSQSLMEQTPQERTAEPAPPLPTPPLPSPGTFEPPVAETPPAQEKRGNTPKKLPQGLNPRQQRAWPDIVKQESITRGRYEELLAGEISARTAIYDLQDLVTKGLLRKKGHGPATRYMVVREKVN